MTLITDYRLVTIKRNVETDHVFGASEEVVWKHANPMIEDGWAPIGPMVRCGGPLFVLTMFRLDIAPGRELIVQEIDQPST